MDNKASLIFFPSAGAGHLGPMVELAKIITLRHPQISITIFTTDLPFPKQSDDPPPVPPTPSINFIHLPLPQNPHELDLDLAPVTNIYRYIQSFSSVLKEAVSRLSSSPNFPPPAGFVLDMFCTSFMEVAKEMSLPSFVYFTSGAAFLNLCLRSQELLDHKNQDVSEMDHNSDLSVPGFLHPIPFRVLPPVVAEKKGGSVDTFLDISRTVRKMDGILINTFYELESHSLTTLAEDKAARVPPIYAVGPLLNSTVGDDDKKVQRREEIIGWLDCQPEKSVAFLCFGSMGCFPPEQVREMAEGVERSGHRFLLSLRAPPTRPQSFIPTEYSGLEEVLPAGFLEKTEGRGKVIGWAPQREILGHPAVGGFVSHCGWNSTLESLWCGVPMATWPMYAEQQLNAFVLVKEVGVAVDVRMDYQKDTPVTVTAEEIERGIRGVMADEAEVRAKAGELREKGRESVAEGGGSYRSLHSFLQSLSISERN